MTPAAGTTSNPPELEAAASTADAVVYGTLASRDATTRDAVRTAAAAARQRVVDINWPPFMGDAVVASAARRRLLKLNDDELAPVAAALTRAAPSAAASPAAAAADAASAAPDDAVAVADAAAALGDTGATTVIVTRGENGAVVSSGGSAWACGGFVAPARPTRSAPATASSPRSWSSCCAARRRTRRSAACRLGAFVAGRPGATPEHEVATIASLSPCAWGVDECVLEL